MKIAINKALDLLESSFTPQSKSISADDLTDVIDALMPVHDLYLELIAESISHLRKGQIQASHDLLQDERSKLTTTLERIGHLVEQTDELDDDLLKLIVLYLFSRARLLDELKMFPKFGRNLVERLEPDEDVDETIGFMESVMTGHKDLYHQILQLHQQNRS